ncbi:MAG: alginate biosynthesis protein AlgX [Moraxellaceae bacterium]|jgi:alginate biosynthesis protein AlgX|nr:alginate biosynthesis protein AlgX [Moraxellaceae bacterium]
MLRSLCFLALCLAAVLPARAQAACAPGTPCYALCPQVAEEQYYAAAAAGLRYLFNGEGSWLFATQLDLRSDFRLDTEAMRGMTRLADAFRRAGTQVVIVYLPPRGLVHHDRFDHASYDPKVALASYRAALAQLRAAGYIVPDLSTLVPDRDGDFFQRRDHHWQTAGARKTAALVATAVRALPVYAQMPRQAFQTERTGITGKYGTLATVAGRICDMRFPRQFFETWTTLPGALDEAALFGDANASEAEVMLIGTSNSKGKIDYNFAGFLQSELGVAVENRALRGGGYNGALEQLLVEGRFASKPPKILVWELPSQYDLDLPMFYRQAVPMLTGACRGKPLLTGRAALSAELIEDVINNGRGGVITPLVARRTALKLRFSDPSVNVFFLDVTYMNGDHEQVKVERHPYVKHDGTFLIELPRTGPLATETVFSAGVRLAHPPAKPVFVDAEACTHDAS